MDAQAWSQATGRIGSLEDLLRRNESSLGAALGRVKDIETALNTMHRALGRIGPDLSSTIDEVKGTKRRLDLVDATAQSKIRDVEGALQQEIRANKPIPLGSDPVFQRLASEHNTTHTDLQETISQVRRLTDAVSADGKALRAVESDTRWLGEQVRDQVAAHRDLSNTSTRRFDQVAGDIHAVQEEVRQVDSGLRKIIDAAVQASREELMLRLEQETKARMALQADFVAAFGRMRDDVIKGFSETATNLKNLDETAHSLETVLRAEVRSRMAAQEEHTKRVDGVEERLRREALSAAEYLKALDTQMSAALRDVRDVSASECRSQLDTVWRSVDDLSDQVKKIHSKQTAENATNEEIAATRTKMLVDTAVQDSREEVMKHVNSRIASATAEIEACASKSEVQELRTRLDLKVQELERKSEGGRHSVVKFDTTAAPDHSSSTSTAMRLKKLGDRVEDAEKQLLVVAEAVRDVHEELVEKLERVETQSASLDALQKSLQTTFERDQAAMQEQTAALRNELIGVMEEVEKIRPPVDGDGAAKNGDDESASADQDQDADPSKTPAAHDRSASPSSPSARFSHKALEQQLQSLRQDVTGLQHDSRKDFAELKSQQEQLYERHVNIMKTHREDHNALKADIAAVSERAQQNAEQISDRLHVVTEASNNNFAKLNEDVAAIAEGKGLAPRPAGDSTHAAGASSNPDAINSLRDDVRDLRTRCNQFDVTLREHTDAIDLLSKESSNPPPAERAAQGYAQAEPAAGTSRPASGSPPQRSASPKTPPGDRDASRPQSKSSAAPSEREQRAPSQEGDANATKENSTPPPAASPPATPPPETPPPASTPPPATPPAQGESPQERSRVTSAGTDAKPAEAKAPSENQEPAAEEEHAAATSADDGAGKDSDEPQSGEANDTNASDAEKEAERAPDDQPAPNTEEQGEPAAEGADQ